jgi:hypothetical protein
VGAAIVPTLFIFYNAVLTFNKQTPMKLHIINKKKVKPFVLSLLICNFAAIFNLLQQFQLL